MSLDIIEAVAGLPALKGWDGLGMAIQAYGKRARPTIAWADALGASDRPPDRGAAGQGRLLGHRDQARAGAGLADYPVFTRKAMTDVSYVACAKIDMLAAEHLSRNSPPTMR
jgi:RHH-type proline utilization regulon transcriptional repressor/proline dehydrogenase/delta 1-pyrroline-5-carboxylate dehydrogenase